MTAGGTAQYTLYPTTSGSVDAPMFKYLGLMYICVSSYSTIIINGADNFHFTFQSPFVPSFRLAQVAFSDEHHSEYRYTPADVLFTVLTLASYIPARGRKIDTCKFVLQ